MKDVVDVTANRGSVVVGFTAGSRGDWVFHVDEPRHIEGGMITLVQAG